MVNSDLSDDDAYSTQLEGKKLRKRGVVIDGELVQIDEDSPGSEKGTQEKRQFFTERELGGDEESEEDREERLKKEREAVRRQQQEELQRQQQALKEELQKDPNNLLDKIEQGVMLSQNRGKPLQELEFKRDGVETSREKGQEKENPSREKRNDLAGAYMALGDNVKKMDFRDQPQPDLSEQLKYSLNASDVKGSIPATKVPDIREKDKTKDPQIER